MASADGPNWTDRIELFGSIPDMRTHDETSMQNLSTRDKQRLTWLAGGIVFLLFILMVAIVGFQLGMSRGLSQAQAAAATAAAQRAALVASTFTPTASATATNTRAPTFTPTSTSTPTPTPSTAGEWAERYITTASEGLNTLSRLDFSPERAEALVERLAQESGMAFVPVSYTQLSDDPWAAFVSPRTPQGDALPMLFWRNASLGDLVQGQLLGDVVETLTDPLTGQEPLVAGLSLGVLRSDPQGRYHALLIERPEAGSKLSAILLSQARPGGPFSLTWRSNDDPVWSFQAVDSTVGFEDTDGGWMPDVVIRGPLPVDSPLRERDDLPSVFIEQSPFARQRLEARWKPMLEGNGDPGAPAVLAGYQLQSTTVEPSPLTTLASMLDRLQAGDVNRAQAYTTRIDILDEAARLGMIAAWRLDGGIHQ